MDIIEIIAWLVVSIVGVGIVGVYLPRSPKVTPVETELQKLRSPSPEAVAKVKARDEELARTRSANIVTVSDDVEIELLQLRRPSPEAVAIVKARDEELANKKAVTSPIINNDIESNLLQLRRPSPEAVAMVKARDEELARMRVENSFFEQGETQQPRVPSPEAITKVEVREEVLKLTTPKNTENKKTARESQKPKQKPVQVEIKDPTEKLTMENMNPDTKKMLTEFLMYPTKDYIGLSNLLSTHDTDAKLRTYLSSRIGMRKAKRRTFYE